MTGGVDLGPTKVLAALDQRVAVVAAELLDSSPGRQVQDGAAASVLAALVNHCREAGDASHTWLVLVAALGRWPSIEEVASVHRLLGMATTDEVLVELLGRVLEQPLAGSPSLGLDLVVGGVVVCADFCARHEFGSGIHRTVRTTLPRWQAAGREFVLTAYTDSSNALRTLDDVETARVLAYDAERPEASDGARRQPRLVVPWKGVLVLPEVPMGPITTALAGAAACSGNAVTGVGYDAIPLVHADLRRDHDSERFAGYLSVVAHLRRVAAISASATLEFTGFAEMLAPQGLPGPSVVEVVLPAQPPAPESQRPDVPLLPRDPHRVQVLCVGAPEAHKNHPAILYAAERLWREGCAFDLTFVGGRGWTPEAFDAAYGRASAAGRPVRHLGRLSDDLLDAAYREADFTVFLSLHEGYGLPAAESLSCGTPVLTSDFGSLAEIAADGGALLADPRDDEQIVDRMRRLVMDGDLRARLAAEAGARPVRGWDDYASELWDALVSR